MFYSVIVEGNYSIIGYCTLKNTVTVENLQENPILYQQYDYEKQGLEDPRIVIIDGIYY